MKFSINLKFIFFLVLSIFFTNRLLAESLQDKTAGNISSTAVTNTTPTIGENFEKMKFWYLYFDQGFGGQVNPESIRTEIDNYGAGSRENDASLNLGLLGLYFRLGQSRNLLGSQLVLYDDAYNAWQGHALNVVQSYITLSGMHFFTPRIGEGFFTKLDLGETRASLTDRSSQTVLRTVNGFRVQCGGGYAIPLGKRANYSLLGLLNGIVQTDNSGTNSAAGVEVRLGILF